MAIPSVGVKNGTNTSGNKESEYREPKRIGDARLLHVAVRLLIWHSCPEYKCGSDSVYTHNDVLAADLADHFSAKYLPVLTAFQRNRLMIDQFAVDLDLFAIAGRLPHLEDISRIGRAEHY
jgi:hypothetical protein